MLRMNQHRLSILDLRILRQRVQGMNEFFSYFFGQGIEPEFALFTLAHIIPIAWMIGIILLIYFKRERIRKLRWEENLRYVLAFALIICDMSYYWRLAGVPQLSNGAIESLPIGVCAWATIFAAIW